MFATVNKQNCASIRWLAATCDAAVTPRIIVWFENCYGLIEHLNLLCEHRAPGVKPGYKYMFPRSHGPYGTLHAHSCCSLNLIIKLYWSFCMR